MTVQQLRVTSLLEGAERSALCTHIAALRLEFPTSKVDLSFADAGKSLCTLHARDWRSPTFDPFEFDIAVASKGDAEIEIRGEAVNANALATVTREVLIRYQRLWPMRNRQSETKVFDQILERHRSLHDCNKPLVLADFNHALDTWQWVLRLDPNAGLPVQVAALFHDVERLVSEADVRVEQHAAHYQAFKDAHACGSSAIVTRVLAQSGLSRSELEQVSYLVERHERPQNNKALMLLNDADALSFFSINSSGFIRYFGNEHTEKKVRYSLARISEHAREWLFALRLRQDLREMLHRALAEERREPRTVHKSDLRNLEEGVR